MGSENKYVFAVSQDANKLELLKAIKELYGVMPVKVNIINTKGKQTRHGQTKGKQKDWKRAVITLKQGEKIEEYKGVQNIH